MDGHIDHKTLTHSTPQDGFKPLCIDCERVNPAYLPDDWSTDEDGIDEDKVVKSSEQEINHSETDEPQSYEDMSYEVLAEDEDVGPLVQEVALRHLHAARDYLGAEGLTGQCDEHGYLLLKNGASSGTKPSDHFSDAGAQVIKEEVLTRLEASDQHEESELAPDERAFAEAEAVAEVPGTQEVRFQAPVPSLEDPTPGDYTDVVDRIAERLRTIHSTDIVSEEVSANEEVHHVHVEDSPSKSMPTAEPLVPVPEVISSDVESPTLTVESTQPEESVGTHKTETEKEPESEAVDHHSETNDVQLRTEYLDLVRGLEASLETTVAHPNENQEYTAFKMLANKLRTLLDIGVTRSAGSDDVTEVTYNTLQREIFDSHFEELQHLYQIIQRTESELPKKIDIKKQESTPALIEPFKKQALEDIRALEVALKQVSTQHTNTVSAEHLKFLRAAKELKTFLGTLNHTPANLTQVQKTYEERYQQLHALFTNIRVAEATKKDIQNKKTEQPQVTVPEHVVEVTKNKSTNEEVAADSAVDKGQEPDIADEGESVASGSVDEAVQRNKERFGQNADLSEQELAQRVQKVMYTDMRKFGISQADWERGAFFGVGRALSAMRVDDFLRFKTEGSKERQWFAALQKRAKVPMTPENVQQTLGVYVPKLYEAVVKSEPEGKKEKTIPKRHV